MFINKEEEINLQTNFRNIDLKRTDMQFLGSIAFKPTVMTLAAYCAAARYDANTIRNGRPKFERDRQLMKEEKGLLGEILITGLFGNEVDAIVEPLVCIYQEPKPDLNLSGIKFDVKTEFVDDGHIYINVKQHQNQEKLTHYYIIALVDKVYLKADFYIIPHELVDKWEHVEAKVESQNYYKFKVAELRKVKP